MIGIRPRYVITVIAPLALVTLLVWCCAKVVLPWRLLVALGLGFGAYSVLLYLPDLIMRCPPVRPKCKPAVMYVCGVFLIVAGCFAAHAIPISIEKLGNEVALASNVVDSFDGFVLVIAAVTGGTLCADAILGIEVGESPLSIGPVGCLIGAGVYFAASALSVAHFGGSPFDPSVLWALILTGVSPLAAWWYCRHDPKQKEWFDRPATLIVCGLMLVLVAAVLELGAQISAGTKEAGEFLRDLMPAFSAAIGACLIARGVETNKPPFDHAQWIIDHLKPQFNWESETCSREEVTITFPKIKDRRLKIVVLTCNSAMTEILQSGDTARRREIAIKACKWLNKMPGMAKEVVPAGPNEINKPAEFHYILDPQRLDL